MLRRNFIKSVSLVMLCNVLTGVHTLSAQALASLGNVKQAELDLSNTVRLLEQNILLALTAGVVLLGIVLVFYVFKENTQSNASRQNSHNHFLSLIILVVGTGMFCSSCGVAQEMQATPPDLTQAHIQSGCPHHLASQEPVAFANIYRTIGYPAQRISTCKFCGQRIVNTRD